MATLTTALEQRVVLTHISWETYERLLSEIPETTSLRLYYDQGDLEIMVLGYPHELFRHAFVHALALLEAFTSYRLQPSGSMTCRRADVKCGFEADASYYIQNASRIAGRTKIDLPEDPPPDLVIEIDISSSSLRKLPIFQAMGVPEVWRWHDDHLSMHVLGGGEYVSVEESFSLPGVRRLDVERVVGASLTENRDEWLKRVRAWAESIRR